MLRSLVCFCILVSVAGRVSGAIPQHLITQLPGLSTPASFSQYAGYINVSTTSNVTRNLFYWFVESQNNPATDPVLLWMNGGPGASSLMGFFTEHGPFRPNGDGKTLWEFPYSWNRIASIIYLEAPLGVGFSYSSDTRDYITDDRDTASNNYQFLLNWFAAYPEYKKNPFYITGESYAGHYIPELADLVLEGNIQVNNNPKSPMFINVTGLLIGNPVTDDDWYYNVNGWSYLTMMYSHGLIPQPAYVAAVEACNWQNFLTNCASLYVNTTQYCREKVRAAEKYIPIEVIDPYDIYAPVCVNFSIKASALKSPYRSAVPSTEAIPFEPCLSKFMTSYLNLPEVQSAIHARPTIWAEQSKKVLYVNRDDVMIPYYQKFFRLAPQWRILVYSGDVDSAVPFLGTQRWIECLNRPVVVDYHNWIYNEQIAGTVKEYNGISYCTIKGCGHMVPYFMPQQGYAFYSRWLQGLPI